MSIRLKKVEWGDSENMSYTRIIGIGVEVTHIPSHGWIASLVSGKVFPNRKAAKAACEQHALERIREAVEVEPNSPEIPDGWRDISTAPELEQVLIAYRGVNPNKPLIDVAFYHPDAKSWDVCGHVRVNPVRVFAWQPLPKPPKEVAP